MPCENSLGSAEQGEGSIADCPLDKHIAHAVDQFASMASRLAGRLILLPHTRQHRLGNGIAAAEFGVEEFWPQLAHAPVRAPAVRLVTEARGSRFAIGVLAA